MNIKGKDYLEVKWRLVWFREEHPDWNLDTQLLHSDETPAIFSCKIYDQNGRQVSSGHGSESTKDWGDYIEKAETKAVGRALAMLGYGTQFAPELDEEERKRLIQQQEAFRLVQNYTPEHAYGMYSSVDKEQSGEE